MGANDSWLGQKSNRYWSEIDVGKIAEMVLNTKYLAIKIDNIIEVIENKKIEMVWRFEQNGD